jgi:hypothetical protein
MKEMTKGTVEYNEALMQANAEAMELIKNNKELADKYTIENGLIKIEPEDLDAAL